MMNDGKDFVVYRKGSGNTYEILDIAVNSARRRGVGTALVEAVAKVALEDGATTLWAITRVENNIAQQFYEALNFEVVGVLRRFYGGEGADAIMYGRRPGGRT